MRRERTDGLVTLLSLAGNRFNAEDQGGNVLSENPPVSARGVKTNDTAAPRQGLGKAWLL